MAINQVGPGGTEGTKVPGLHSNVIQSVVTARTLIAAESSSLCVNDVATGIVWTLPVPVVGMRFRFKTTVSRTSTNAYKVITNASTVFLVGAVMAGDATIATSGDIFTADGTTHRAIVCDGDTKGGFVGESYEFECISATQWLVTGLVIGTGTMVTPFTTS